MSKTYKNYPFNTYHRNPKGRKKAIQNGCRPKAIPPSSWDDIPIDKQCWRPWKIGGLLVDQGLLSTSEIIKKLMKKFNLKYKEAEKIVNFWIR